MNILGVIPARGGSKGVRRKNIRLLGGKPLISYTIDSCKQSQLLTQFVVSTEDSEIAEVSRSLGGNVILRPEELARDVTPSLPVIQHATLKAEEEFCQTFQIVCLLQPTTPLRVGKHIDEAIEVMTRKGSDSVISVCRIPDKYHPNWAFINKEEHLRRVLEDQPMVSRRQMLSPVYCRNGAIYGVRRNILVEDGSLYGESVVGYEMPESDSINIDSIEDWEHANRRFEIGR